MKNLTLIITISFLLFLFGFMGLSFITGYGLLGYWQQKLQFIVELRDDLNENDFNELQILLESAPFVNENSLNIITKDEAVELMKNDFGDEFLTLDIENPLRNVYTFNVNANFSDAANLEKIKAQLLQNAAVADVFYEQNRSQGVVKNIANFLWVAIILAILFIFVAVFVIRQNIILNWIKEKEIVFAAEDRDTALENSKKENFWRNVKNGIWSGAIAILALIIYNFWFNQGFNELTAFTENIYIVVLFAIILIISVLCFVLTTFFLQKKQIIDTF
jgi:cell division transport system permease protein